MKTCSAIRSPCMHADAIKIACIVVHQATLPLEKPFRLSGGRLVFEALDSAIARVATNAGIDGIGEGCP